MFNVTGPELPRGMTPVEAPPVLVVAEACMNEGSAREDGAIETSLGVSRVSTLLSRGFILSLIRVQTWLSTRRIVLSGCTCSFREVSATWACSRCDTVSASVRSHSAMRPSAPAAHWVISGSRHPDPAPGWVSPGGWEGPTEVVSIRGKGGSPPSA